MQRGLAIGFGVGIIVLIILSLWWLKVPPFASKTTVSGKIVFSALKPDPDDRGNVTIKYRKFEDRKGNFKDAKMTIPLANNQAFNWENAIKGETYELIGELVIDGKVVKQSEPLVVTAPAVDQILSLRVTWKDLPSNVVDEEDADMSGKVTLNGHIPDGSTLLIQAKLPNQRYENILELDPKVLNEWTWTHAQPLKDYIVRAQLVQNGEIIGTSYATEAIAGENTLSLTINSDASHPSDQAQTATAPEVVPTKSLIIASPTPKPVILRGKISGYIQVNGPKDKNSSLLVLYRSPGSGDYKVVTRINDAQSNNQYEWTAPIIGRDYEITTAYQVNENNVATSRSQVVTASARNVNFTINTGITVQNTTGTPEKEACNQINDNEYDVTIKWPRESEAGNYWLQIGENPGESNKSNDKVRASSNDYLRTKLRIQKNKNYYARYAYSYCVNCNSDQNFSNFSNPFRFWCGTDPGS